MSCQWLRRSQSPSSPDEPPAVHLPAVTPRQRTEQCRFRMLGNQDILGGSRKGRTRKGVGRYGFCIVCTQYLSRYRRICRRRAGRFVRIHIVQSPIISYPFRTRNGPVRENVACLYTIPGTHVRLVELHSRASHAPRRDLGKQTRRSLPRTNITTPHNCLSLEDFVIIYCIAAGGQRTRG